MLQPTATGSPHRPSTQCNIRNNTMCTPSTTRDDHFSVNGSHRYQLSHHPLSPAPRAYHAALQRAPLHVPTTSPPPTASTSQPHHNGLATPPLRYVHPPIPPAALLRMSLTPLVTLELVDKCVGSRIWVVMKTEKGERARVRRIYRRDQEAKCWIYRVLRHAGRVR